MLQKLKFYGSITTVYILTFGAIGTLLFSPHSHTTTTDAVYHSRNHSHTIPSSPATPATISGAPTRIVIPSYNIDIPIEPGRYDASTKKWTLSDSHAHHAAITPIANNRAGATFIYGHGTDAVFGKIGSNPPGLGTAAYIHTDNDLTFTYLLSNVANHKPDETHVFEKSSYGTPRLIVQTCTGAFSEWRTMFTFTFKEVD